MWGVGREERAGWVGNSEASGSTCGSCTCRRGHAIRYDLLLSLTMTRTHTPVLVLTQTHTHIHTHTSLPVPAVDAPLGPEVRQGVRGPESCLADSRQIEWPHQWGLYLLLPPAWQVRKRVGSRARERKRRITARRWALFRVNTNVIHPNYSKQSAPEGTLSLS